MRTVTTVVVLLGLLGFAAWIAIDVWTDIGEVQISTAGLIAMAGGILLTILVGGGLMFLVFWSSRHGHDELDRRESTDKRGGTDA